jgi:hypothetical protein
LRHKPSHSIWQGAEVSPGLAYFDHQIVARDAERLAAEGPTQFDCTRAMTPEWEASVLQ